MTGKTHGLAGLCAGMALARVVPTDNAGWYVIATVLGALLPDIDEPRSTVSNLPVYFRGYVRQAFGRSVLERMAMAILEGWRLLLRIFAGTVKVLFGHRGVTHRGVACVVATLMAELAGMLLGLPFMGIFAGAGYATHLALDAMTPSGVPLLAPLVRRRVKLPFTIRTGGKGEAVVFITMAIIAVFLSQH